MRFYPANARTVFASQALHLPLAPPADLNDLLPYHRGSSEAEAPLPPDPPSDPLSAYPLPTGLTYLPESLDGMMAT